MKLRNINAAASSLRLPSGNFVNLEGYFTAEWIKDRQGGRYFEVLMVRHVGSYSKRFSGEDARHVAAYLRACSDTMTED